jgi:predicted GTPase
MSDLPLPLPDRRTLGSSTSPHFNSSNINKFSQDKNKSIEKQNNNNNINDTTESNSLSLIKLKQIEDMRQKILNYSLLTEKSIFFTYPSGSSKINRCNIILFGPSGSGKSSFIKSLYRALYNSPILPPEATNKLKVKNIYHNEGTINFTQLHLVEESQNSSGIVLCDTRGQVKMNENEKEQFKIILDGKVKDGVKVEQRENRDPFALWEFWKKSSELFPNEILNLEEPTISSIPHSVVFIFDGSSDEVVQGEDEKFYKDLVVLCKRKGYTNVQIVLTRIDVFEKNVFDRNRNISQSEKTTKLNKLKDIQIEKVIQTLGVNRSNIHFLENYHLEGQEKNSVEIDYHILKTMIDILNSAELFIMSYMNQRETCFCFGGKYY